MQTEQATGLEGYDRHRAYNVWFKRRSLQISDNWPRSICLSM